MFLLPQRRDAKGNCYTTNATRQIVLENYADGHVLGDTTNATMSGDGACVNNLDNPAYITES